MNKYISSTIAALLIKQNVLRLFNLPKRYNVVMFVRNRICKKFELSIRLFFSAIKIIYSKVDLKCEIITKIS